jgi:uncharacterized protein with PQ loop repeat
MAGLGTTCAALPDLGAMLKRRSNAGMNPRMAAITGVFQIVWLYYGLLIASRPVGHPDAKRILAFLHIARIHPEKATRTRTSPLRGCGSSISPMINTSRAAPCFSYQVAFIFVRRSSSPIPLV